jgi:hypothetical protein
VTITRAGADHGDHDDEHDEVGEALPGIDEALDEKIDLAAEIAGNDADNDRDERGETSGAEADDDRELRAVETAREHVAAEVVGAERKRRGRGLEPVDRVDLVHAVGREQVGENAAKQEQQEHQAADGAERLLAKQPADEMPRGAAGATAAQGLGDGRHQRYLTLGSSRP